MITTADFCRPPKKGLINMLKKLTALILFFCVIMLLIPYCFCAFLKPVNPGALPSVSNAFSNDAQNENEAVPASNSYCEPETLKSYITDKNEVCEINFEDYIKGVVAAEMPAAFEKEALKAQAVAARSYILSKMQSGTKHENGADVCDNPSHCKAYLPPDKLKQKWGDEFDSFYAKICECCDETKNCVMLYDGKIVNALFHSTSSGKTESARDVWGGDVPYLVSVASFGDELSPRYHSSTAMSINEFKQKLKSAYPDIYWKDGENLIGDAVRSEAGGIITMNIANITLSGSELRNIFSLRSTHIDFDITNDTVTLNVTGNGHGVGMSQYGANYLACQNKTFTEILKTYYSGVEVVRLNG